MDNSLILKMVDVRVFDEKKPIRLEFFVDQNSRSVMLNTIDGLYDANNELVSFSNDDRSNTLIATSDANLCYDWDMCFNEKQLEEAVLAYRAIKASKLLDLGDFVRHDPQKVIETKRFSIRDGEVLEVDTSSYTAYQKGILIACLAVKHLLGADALCFGDKESQKNHIDMNMMPQLLNNKGRGRIGSSLPTGKNVLGRLFSGK